MVGETVSHYRIVEELGGGGMGVVYRAEDTHLGRDVALKFLPPELTRDPEARRRFQLEARAASALDHANICTIYDIDETEDGRLYIAMAFYSGATLKTRLAEGPVAVEEAIEIARQIASGLERAHEGGIIHRDIKPANVMVTGRGEVKILDFGIAKLAGEAGLTRTGSTLGTLAYMSPEQVEGDEVGPAADLWALGVLLYRMLTGELPFEGKGEAETVGAILAREPAAPSSLRKDVPAALEALVLELLSKDPGSRPTSAGEVADRLSALGRPAAPGPATPLHRRPATWIATAAVLALVAAAIAIPARNRARVDAARASLADIETLAREGRYAEAFVRAEAAEEVLGADSTLDRLMRLVADSLSVSSEPAGAEVYLRPFASTAERDSALQEIVARAVAATGVDPGRGAGGAIFAGTTPLTGLRLPHADYRLTVEADGHETIERVVSSRLPRADPALLVESRHLAVDVRLPPAGSLPDDMVRVPAGSYTLVSADAPASASADLTAFLIDRYEVTNADYADFVRAGGYDRPELWPAPIEVEGRAVPPAGIRSVLVDRTDLPGPRHWTGQAPPEGSGRHPVTHVTWYEAAAYCAWREKSLPTLFEWEKAARGGAFTHTQGFVMPWGLLEPHQSTDRRANYGGSGTVPVDAHPFGLSPYGVYAMAGNVREWTANPTEEGIIAMGGSWRDPAYVFSSIATPEPDFAAPDLGFRCVRRDVAAGAHGGGRIELARRSPSYEPVDEATYRSFLTHYVYDPVELAPEILETVEAEDWTRLRVRFNGISGEPIPAYLYLPRSAEPPYQTLVHVPSTIAFLSARVDERVEAMLAPHIRSGRAAFSVVLEGMVERPRPPGWVPESHTVEFRNLMVRHATELSLGLDYLETRDDIDMDRLAYVGVSWGAGSRSLLAAIDERWDAVIYIGGGIDERLHPTVPEALNVNFLPYIEAPKLLVNGRQDEEHPWLTRALPFWELLREPKELVLVDNQGHLPAPEVRVPAINDFLDRHFGPVR